MRIAFAGTPAFARVALERVHGAGHEVVLVLTQPDRAAGRGMKPQPSSVKQFALEQGLPLAQPQGLRLDGRFATDAVAARAAMLAARPDVMVVAAYGLILPEWALELPRLGCLNIHASLLPRWRGAAPIHRAIEAGDARTGVTIMQMDAGLDTGDMLLAQAEPIRPDDNTARLHDRLAALGAELALRSLALAERGSLVRTPQPSQGITYAHKIDKAEAVIDWQLDAAAIERRLRAFDPFPGATALLGGEPIKVWQGRVTQSAGLPGEVLAVGPGGIEVACGQGALVLAELQRPGGRRMAADAFLQGRPMQPGQRFGLPQP